MMRALVGVWAVAGVMLTTAAPTLAMDSMTKGEGMMIMSNGQMATMKTMDPKASATMMKHAMKGCVMMMMGADGKMYMMQATDKQCGDMAKSKM